MKKIKYGKRKGEGGHRELDNLKEDDEICEGVLDTLSDDYLSYISHLVKHSKTPQKNNGTRDREQPSSDSQPTQSPNLPTTQHNPPFPPPPTDNRTRHHSETGPKRTPFLPPKDSAPPSNFKEYQHHLSNKLSSGKKGENRGKQQYLGQKKRKRKGDSPFEEFSIKNEQKTMSFSRNFQDSFEVKYPDQKAEKYKHLKPRDGPKLKQKYYTNYREYSQSSNEIVSITDNMLQNHTSQRDSLSYPFLDEIDNYLSHLQTKPKQKSRAVSRKGKDKYLKELSVFQMKKKEQEYEEYDIKQILKENLKLKKKVKSYEDKIEDLEDQVSSHLIQCKTRDKGYKNKINELIKALTQASAKINNQKSQISTMKCLLKTFGQKVKQIENQNDDSDYFEEDVSESIIRHMDPQRHSSDIRNKYKRGLESTMPRHEDDRRFWKD